MTADTIAPTSLRRPARSTRRPATRKSTRLPGKTSTTKPKTSLSTFVANIFYGVFIQDDDSIAETAYTQNWSPDVQEVDDGKPLNFAEFHTFLFRTRAAITDRQLLSQSFVVAPADAGGRAGQVAHTSHWTGLQAGKSVTGTIVRVLKVVWVPGKEQRSGN